MKRLKFKKAHCFHQIQELAKRVRLKTMATKLIILKHMYIERYLVVNINSFFLVHIYIFALRLIFNNT